MTKLTLPLLMVLFVWMLGGCESAPPFEGGIRVQTSEAITGIANSNFPVPGVQDSGNATSGGSNNGAQSFSGVTGALGIDDHPSVAVDTDWTVTVNFATAIPDCGLAEYAAFVPVDGAEFNGVCYVIEED